MSAREWLQTAQLWTSAQVLVTCVMLLLVGLLSAIGAVHAGAQDQPHPPADSLELHARPTVIGRMPSSGELNAIAKRCQIGFWWGKDTITLQGVEPKGQEEEYDRRRDCASRLIKRKGFKGTILVD